MKKVYKSRGKRTSILVEVDGQRRQLNFKQDIIIRGRNVWGSSFTTEDRELQTAIEENEYFKGGQIWTDDKEEESSESMPKKESTQKKSKKISK